MKNIALVSAVSLCLSQAAFAADYVLDTDACDFQNFKGSTTEIPLPTESKYSGLLIQGGALSVNTEGGALVLSYANGFGEKADRRIVSTSQGRKLMLGAWSAKVEDSFGSFWQGNVTHQSWTFTAQQDSLKIVHAYESASPFFGGLKYAITCTLPAVESN